MNLPTTTTALPRPCDSGTTEPGFSPAASLAFWLCLILGGILFAALALAPRIRTYRDLRHEFEGRQRALVTQERRHDYLARVADALVNDADFAAEMGRVDFGAAGPEERIPVSPELSFQGPPQQDALLPPVAASPARLWETPLLDSICDDNRIRGPLIAAVALLVMTAFLSGSRNGSSRRPTTAWRAPIGRWLSRRYALESQSAVQTDLAAGE